MSRQDRKGTCFIISSRGNGTSEVQRRTDQLVKHVIEPAAKECGYEIIRAEHLSHAGLINSQVIDHLIEDSLVIADVGFEDPSVFYELAVRHAANKPVIQITMPGHKTPFEVTGNKTIPVDHKDLDSAAKGKEELLAEIRTLNGRSDPTNPLAASIDLDSLSRSTDLQDRTNAQIIARLEDIKAELREVHRALLPSPSRVDYAPAPKVSRENRQESEPAESHDFQEELADRSLSTSKKTAKEPTTKRGANKPGKPGKEKESKPISTLKPTDIDDFPEPSEAEKTPEFPTFTAEKEPAKRTTEKNSKTSEPQVPSTRTKKPVSSSLSSSKKERKTASKDESPEKPFKPGKRSHPERRFAQVGTRQSGR